MHIVVSCHCLLWPERLTAEVELTERSGRPLLAVGNGANTAERTHVSSPEWKKIYLRSHQTVQSHHFFHPRFRFASFWTPFGCKSCGSAPTVPQYQFELWDNNCSENGQCNQCVIPQTHSQPLLRGHIYALTACLLSAAGPGRPSAGIYAQIKSCFLTRA